MSGVEKITKLKIKVGENIYGPFEAGFGVQQDRILMGLGCSTGSLGYIDGGIDTRIAEAMVAFQCGIKLPRLEKVNDRYTWISLLDTCGGHTKEYHFHEKLSCLYNHTTIDMNHDQIHDSQQPHMFLLDGTEFKMLNRGHSKKVG